MTREERLARDELSSLARDGQGRRLLQLALRGIQESGRGLTFGCWVKSDGGVSGCLFQHAYWQGVQEGVFRPASRAPGEIKDFVRNDDFALVMGAIRAFDALGRRRYLVWGRRFRIGLPWRTLDEDRWRGAVERILIDVLAGGDAGLPGNTPTPPELQARTG